jgi:hypothetical protein
MTIDHSIHPTSGGQYAFFFSLALVNFTYPCMEFLVRIIGFSLLHYTYQMKKKKKLLLDTAFLTFGRMGDDCRRATCKI